MSKYILMLAIFSVWGLFDLYNIKTIFDKFFILDKPKKTSYRSIWVIYYFVVTYGYCICKLHEIKILGIIFYFLYFTRIIPFIWSGYGICAKVPVLVLVYEEIEALISTNISIFLLFIFKFSHVPFWMDDVLNSVVAILFFILIKIGLYYKNNSRLNIWFANLSVKEYILLISIVYLLGNVESMICFSPDFRSYIKVPMVIITLLVLILIGRVILMNEHVYSIKNVNEILQSQMEKLTGYYSELNDKELHFRQFRHDIKNLLMALHSMIAENKNEQALNYIESVKDIYKKTLKEYDTGNFIADALLGSKSNYANQHETTIDFDGFIPAERINDVDMVILLSNILDNAIEACEKIEGKKTIRISSVLNKQTWVFTVKNPSSENIDICNNHIITSKEDKSIHGFGIMNIEKVVKNYNGMIKFSCENNEFTVRATLQLKEEN